nr:sugar transferase [Qipengyuania citrea]
MVLVSAVLIRLSSPGPVIFRQTRVGRNQKLFTCLKLRTMRAGTPDLASHMTNSGLITPIGRVLRRYKLDEIPQVWNIVRGDMSFVGPRPCLPSQNELIEARHALGVYNIRPGITGISQVSGVDMSRPLLLAKLDATYLTSMNLKHDIKLILATAFGAGRGDRVVT